MAKCFRPLIRKEAWLIINHHLATNGSRFLYPLLPDHVLLHVSESIYAILLAIVRSFVYVLYLLLVLLLIMSAELGRT